MEFIIDELKFLSENVENVSINFIKERLKFLYDLAFEITNKQGEKK